MKINIAVLGYGYWGPNLVRNFNKISNCNISYIVDKDINKLNTAKKLYPHVNCISNPLIALKDNSVNAIVIALPVNQHYKYAKLALENNKHVLIEKPATDSYKKLKILVNIAKKKNLKLMVDYTFLYTNEIHKIKQLISKGVIGDILFIGAQRLNLGKFRKDVNVIQDLSVHDFSIIQYLINKYPKELSAIGFKYVDPKISDVAYVVLKYNEKQKAHISSSWLFPFKNKKLIVIGSKKTIMYDDSSLKEKVMLFNKRFNEDTFNVSVNKKIICNIDIKEEPLYKVCKTFLNSIAYNKTVLTDGDFALKVSVILSACNKSLAEGKIIKL